MKRRAAMLLALLMMSSTSSYAFSVDPKEACEASSFGGILKPRYVQEKLFADHSILPESNGLLDYDARYMALIDQTCSKCSEQTIAKLKEAFSIFTAFWNAHAREPALKTSSFRTSPAINYLNFRDVALGFFSSGKKGLKVQALCLNVDDTHAGPAPQAPKFIENVRIRKTAKDLQVDRHEADAFKALDPASFAASRNYINAIDSYDIEGVIGYSIERPTADNWYKLIPYLYYKRQHIGKKPVADSNEIENVGTGILSKFLLRTGQYSHELAIYPEVMHSTRTHVTTLSGNATFTPDFSAVGVNTAKSAFGLDWLKYKIGAQVTATYASLLDNGDASVLRENYDSFRYGPTLSFWLGITQGWFEDLSGSVSYDYLDLVTRSGTLSHIAQFTSTLVYSMPKQDYWSLKLTYVDGRDLNTFEKQRQITFGLGLRY